MKTKEKLYRSQFRTKIWGEIRQYIHMGFQQANLRPNLHVRGLLWQPSQFPIFAHPNKWSNSMFNWSTTYAITIKDRTLIIVVQSYLYPRDSIFLLYLTTNLSYCLWDFWDKSEQKPWAFSFSYFHYLVFFSSYKARPQIALTLQVQLQ